MPLRINALWILTAIGELPKYAQKDTPLEIKKGTVSEGRFTAPTYLFEAPFRALESMRSNYNFNDIDLVTNRGTLAKLIRFSSGKYKLEDFGLQLYTIGNTLFIETCDPDLDGTINRPRSLGHDFERAVTQSLDDTNDIGTYHRFLQYNIGSLKCAVICEVDASCDYSRRGVFREAGGEAAAKINGPASAKASRTENEASEHAGFQVILHGSPISHAKTAEIKTIVADTPTLNPRKLNDFLQQLWLIRQNKLILGFHERPKSCDFYKIQFRRMDSKIRGWEKRNKSNLGKTVTLIYLLKREVKNSRTRRAVQFTRRNGLTTSGLGEGAGRIIASCVCLMRRREWCRCQLT